MSSFALLVTRRPWAVLLVWLLLLLACAPFALRAPKALSADPGSLPHSDSARVTAILKDHFGETNTNAVLLVTHSDVPDTDPRFLAAYDRFMSGLTALPGVSAPGRFDSPSAVRTVSADGKLTLSTVQIPLRDGASAALKRVRAYVMAQQAGQQAGAQKLPFTVQVTGGQAIADDFTAFAETDTKRSELTALPLTAVVLLVVFGALVATGLPLAVAVLSVTVALAGLYGLTQFTVVSTFAQSVVTLLGLGAGIDYALLMVNRFREELAREQRDGGGDSRSAAARTIQTAGRSVAFSGLTVSIAMAALLIPPISYVRSMGLGGVLVMLLTVLASVTALPAAFALLGERVNSPRRLRLGRFQTAGESVGWTRFARAVIGRPWMAVLGSAALLLLLAYPALDLKTGYAGAFGLTAGVESRDALASVRQLGAGGLLSSFEVVLDPDGGYTPARRNEFQAVVTRLRAVLGVQAVVSPFLRPGDLKGGSASTLGGLGALSALTQRSISRDRQYLRVTVIPGEYLRADQIDAFTARLRAALNAAGTPYILGGAPVGGREFSRAITGATPLAIGVVFGATFLLLMVAFRSLLIPLKSIVTNALTVGAAYGVVVLVVQKGVLAGLLGIPTDVGVLDSSLPLILFAVMFGLSMDYEIFLLSRVQEEHLKGASNDEAVVLAVGRTARIITSAAVIMFIVFSAFVVGRVVASKSIGLGLAVAVLLDSTLVRLVLVPGFLKLAGEWNWWLPGWLGRRLPRVQIDH